MISIAVFDLDGTLLNTLKDLAAAGNYSLAAHGFAAHPVDAYKRFVGSGMFNLVSRALPAEHRGDEALIRAVLADMSAYYAEHLMVHTRPYDGVVPLLRSLKARGVVTGILTNKPHRHAAVLIQELLPGLIDLVRGQREGVPIKPDPAGLLELLAHFHKTPAECIYVGDSVVDLHTGQNAGVHTVGVSWGFVPKSTLEAQGDFVIVDKVEELAAILIDNCEKVRYTSS